MRIPQGAHAAPKSTPQPGSPFGGAGLTPVATPKQTCQPSPSWRTVALRTAPPSGRDRRNRSLPTLGRRTSAQRRDSWRTATAAPHAPASGRGTAQTRGSSHRAAARRTAVAPARCSTPRGSCDPTRQAHSLLGGRIGTVAATSVGDHAGMLLGRWDTIRTFAGQLWSASYFAGPWVVHRWTSCAPTSTARTGQPDPPSKSAASLRHHPEGQHTLG